jgi:hypothetical protein
MPTLVSHKYGSGSIHQAKRFILKNDVNVPVCRIWLRIRRNLMFLGLPDPHLDPLVRGTDPRMDPHPDPYQNVTDPQNWFKKPLKRHRCCVAFPFRLSLCPQDTHNTFFVVSFNICC